MKMVVTGGSGKVGRYVVDEVSREHQVTVFDRVAPEADVQFVQGDITDPEACRSAFRGADAVLHLAAIPHPLTEAPSRIMQVNVVGTYCVLDACAEMGVRRLVMASTDSVYGFFFQRDFTGASPSGSAFAPGPARPERLPIDERHPARAHDPYGLSKILCERAAESYSRAVRLNVICLRLMGVWTPDRYPVARSILGNADRGALNLWTYVEPRDVAQAFRLAAEAERVEPFDVMLVAAADAATPLDVRQLVAKYYPNVEVTAPLSRDSSLYDCSRAAQMLGYSPKHSWRTLPEFADLAR
jgi:nucleoside-diphosphate-sugar epimerase